MSEPIVSRDYVAAKARRAVDDGLPITACPFPAESEAAKTWREQYQVRMAELTSEVHA